MGKTSTYDKSSFMFGIPEAKADKHNTRVNEEADEDAGSDDLGIGIFVLVQVPCSTYTQKFAAISCTIQDYNDEVDNLQKSINLRNSYTSITFRIFF